MIQLNPLNYLLNTYLYIIDFFILSLILSNKGFLIIISCFNNNLYIDLEIGGAKNCETTVSY